MWDWLRRLRGATPPDGGAGERRNGERWVVLDVETTGLDPSSDRLLAIAAVALPHDGREAWTVPADSFEGLVAHEEDASGLPDDEARQNILLHGIGLGARRAGAPPAEVLRAFAAWAGGAPRVGFHVAFDRAMIERAEKHWLGAVTPARWLDVEPLAAVLERTAPARAPGARWALDDWLTHFAIPCRQRHQAIADAEATAELLLRLWPGLRAEKATDSASALTLAERRRWLAP